MNVNTSNTVYTAKMLVTPHGFMVQVRISPEDKASKIVCFFVGEEFEHHVWKLTKTIGLIPYLGEYNRLKGSCYLREIAPSAKQLAMATELAKKLSADPYFGLSEELKAEYLALPADSAAKKSLAYASKLLSNASAQKEKHKATYPSPKETRVTPPASQFKVKQAAPKKPIVHDSKEAIRAAKRETKNTMLGMKGGFDVLAALRSA